MFYAKNWIFCAIIVQIILILALFNVGDKILVGEILSYFFCKNPTKSWHRYQFTLDCFATRDNKMCDRFFSAAWEYECEAVNFCRQQISPEEYCWVFPHPRLTSKTIGRLADCGARAVMLLIYLPSLPGFFPVFSAGKVARIVRRFFRIFPSWESPPGIESSFFRGPARQKVFIVEFNFGVTNPMDFV